MENYSEEERNRMSVSRLNDSLNRRSAPTKPLNIPKILGRTGYMLLQITFLTLLLFKYNLKENLIPYIIMLVFSVVTILMYWIVALKNPGFIKVNLFKLETEAVSCPNPDPLRKL